jgi:glutaredoxin
METQVLGLSVDSVPCLKAWADSMGGITYPLLSDFYPHGRVAKLYGVLHSEGHSERAIFILDKQGIVRYVDIHDIDLQPDNDVLLAELEKIDPAAAKAWQETHPTEEYVEPDAPIVMYCTPWCQDCPDARAYFKANNIPYVEIDISRDRTAAARVREWADGSETTPTIKIGGQVIVSFDQEKVEQALARLK